MRCDDFLGGSMREIRTATVADLARVEEIYAAAQRFMVAAGNPSQWGPGFPGRQVLEGDVASGALKVCAGPDGVPQGCFVLLEGPDPTYGRIYDGAWTDEGPYLVVHRFATAVQGRGVGSAMMGWALGRARERGWALRVDTHRDNLPMQGLLRSRGFSYCGVIRLADGSERIAFCLPPVRP
jgi:GNAT superfamily N-acetyltransferase